MTGHISIRTLKPEEITTRVQSVVSYKIKDEEKVGVILLLYKDARVDMNILDEVYGNNNWQRTHEVINGNLFCNIDIWDEDKKTWVRKQDVGTESNTEKEKGQASDSFKRAGTNIGIGRELYTAPLIFIELNTEEYEKDDKSKKYKVKNKTKFKVKTIEYNNNREIIKLQIVDTKNILRFDYK